MKLIAISWPEFFDGEAEIINSLFESGLITLHLRKPDAKETDINRLIHRINPEYHDRLTMHYYPQIAEQFELGGYHISQGRADAPEDWCGRLSASRHTLTEVEQTAAEMDYVFLSPIFDSISKHGYSAAFSKERLREAKEQNIINHKVIALGGISPSMMPQVAEMGFGGAAILGGLWGDLKRDTVMANYWKYLSTRE